MVVASVSGWVGTAFHGELPRTNLIDWLLFFSTEIYYKLYLIIASAIYYDRAIILLLYLEWEKERNVCEFNGHSKLMTFQVRWRRVLPWRQCHQDFWRSMASVEEFQDLFCSCLFLRIFSFMYIWHIYIKLSIITLFYNLIWIVILLKFPIL